MAETSAQVAEGEPLGPLTVELTSACVRAYAEASGDFNPIHVDPVFAAGTEFGAPIAHGMLLLAYIGRLLSARFGRAWVESGELEARFRAPAMVGSTVIVDGIIQQVLTEDSRSVVLCKLRCRGANDQQLVTADARLSLAAG